MLADLERKAARKEAGLVDPYAEHRSRKLTDHVDDYGRFLLAKGDTGEHAKKTVSRCKAIIQELKAEGFDGLQPSAVLEVLAGMREQGRPLVELPPSQQWFKKRELVAILGINPASVARIVNRD